MKSDIDLFHMYEEEKSLVIGSRAERTGLEPFPSFKEWKLEYMKEYALTHDMDNPVTMEEAVAALEAELDDGDEPLSEEDLAALAADIPEATEEDDMSDTPEEAVAAPEAAPAEKPKKVAKKKVTKKKIAAKKRPPSKAKDAQKVFDRLYPRVLTGKKARKDVIDELVNKVGLTANGAATYYQKMKKVADAV